MAWNNRNRKLVIFHTILTGLASSLERNCTYFILTKVWKKKINTGSGTGNIPSKMGAKLSGMIGVFPIFEKNLLKTFYCIGPSFYCMSLWEDKL